MSFFYGLSSPVKVMLVTAVVGLLLGYFGQRSRMCFIGGWRDFFLIRDTYLLKGFFAFVITASLLFFVLDNQGVYLKDYPWYEQTLLVAENIQTVNIKDPCSLPTEVIFGTNATSEGVHFGNIVLNPRFLLSLLAAFLIGIFSTFANGCPMRQHVMAGSGNISAFGYLAGFYAGVIVYQYLLPYLP